MNHKRPKLAVFQRVVPEYRTHVFERLAQESGCEVTVFASSFSHAMEGVKTIRVAQVCVGGLEFHPAANAACAFGNYQVLLVEGSVRLLTSVLAALSPFGPKVVWWTSMWRPDGSIGPGGLARRIVLRGILRRVGAIVTYGTRAAEAVRALGVPGDKVFVAFNSVDTWRLRDAEATWLEGDRLVRFQQVRDLRQGKVILFVGRLIREKRVDVLIRAMGMLIGRMRGREPQLVIVGDGPDRERLKALVETEGLRERVRFEGELRKSEALCPYLLSARVFVLPGTGGLAVNEALTLGVPVVVGGGDGTEYDLVVDGVNGRLLEMPDALTLADAIEKVLDATPERATRLSQNARHRIDSIANVSTMTAGVIGAVRYVLGGNSGMEPAC